MSIIKRIIDEPKRLAPVIPVVLSLYLVLSSFSRPGVTADGHTYLQIARNIHFGIGLGWQALWVPPLHSCLIALVGWVPGVSDLLLSSAIVGALMGVLLVVSVWLLAEEIFGRTVAFGASLITALFPHFLWIYKAPEAESTYTVFLVLSLWLFSVALRRQSCISYVLCGLFFSLAYLARSEGFLVMVFAIGALLAIEGRCLLKGKLLQFTALLLVSFLIASLPYLMFLKKHYGAWVISPKSTYVLIWMKYKTYHDNNFGETDNEELWGLAEDGELRWQVPSGISDLVSYLMSHPEKSARVYLDNLIMEVPGKIPNNSGMEKYPQVFPVILAMAAIVAILRKWGDRSARHKAVILTPFLMMLVLPVFTAGWWKYLVPYAPLLIILGCAGIVFVLEFIIRRLALPAGRLAATVGIVPYALMVVLALYFHLKAFPPHFPGSAAPAPAPQQSESVKKRNLYASEAETAGRWIADKLGPGRNYMVPWSKLIYHLNGLWTAKPVADYAQLHNYALRHGAEYFLVEMNGSVPLEDITNAQPGLKFETMYRSPQTGYTVAAYRFIPLPGR